VRARRLRLANLTAVDFPYIESMFPDFGQYLGDDIGVHTKRGCPFQCHFCLYNKMRARASATATRPRSQGIEMLNSATA